MVIRIPWDEYEEAILLHALMNVLNHNIKRQNAISEVSKQLRALAINRGITIDDKFRNENGIALQMSNLEYAFTDGNSGLRKESGWYFNIVRLYRENYKKYNELLEESMKILGSNKTENIDFSTWIKEHQSDYATGILTSMKVLNILLLKDRTIHVSLLRTTNINEIESLMGRLRNNKGVNIHGKKQKAAYIAALTAYRDYLLSQQSAGNAEVENTKVESADVQKSSKSVVNTDEKKRILKILDQSKFEYGFRNDSVERYRFRDLYYHINGVGCDLSDEALFCAIRECGFEFEGKIYHITDKERELIKSSLENYKNQGVNIIYYESLYEMHEKEYFDAKIISAEMLKSLLMELAPNYCYKSSYVAFAYENQKEIELIYKDIDRVWGDCVLRSFDELSTELPLIPIEKIKYTLAYESSFVRNSNETYTRIDLFNSDTEEISGLISYIDEQCAKDDRISFDDLPLDTLRDKNPELSEVAICRVFYKLIEDKYDKNNKILMKKGESKDTYSAVIEFCREQDKCTYEKLEYIAKRIAGAIEQPAIVKAANAVMVRVNKEDFVADRLIHFDVEKTDAALDHIVISDFLGMREITTFSIFPFCDYNWNLYLLESYCRRFSKKYKYETRRVNSSNVGAIVLKKCMFSYHEIMVYAVARSGRELDVDNVYDFLVKAGYIERKRYSDIGLLINQATTLRERRK